MYSKEMIWVRQRNQKRAESAKTAREETNRQLYPWEYFHSGSHTVRDKRANSMCARPYFRY